MKPVKRLTSFILMILAIAATSAEASREAESASSFVFVVAGDYGASDDSTATLEGVARSGAAFALALGDLSYSERPTEAAWCDYVKAIVGENFPFQLIAGNHEDDYGEDGHIGRFAACLPDKLDSVGAYGREYYFDYRGLVRFILISPDLTIDGMHYYYGDHNANYRWLADVIDEARAAGIPWVVVGMHKNCLSMGPYYCNVYQDLFSLLIEKRVDLVLHAHEHTYQRTRQLAVGAACAVVEVDTFDPDCVVDGEDDVYTRGAGPVFVTVGTAGAELYNIDPDDPEAGYFVTSMGANVRPRKGFLRVKVSAEEISAEYVGSTATSNFTDSFRIRSAE